MWSIYKYSTSGCQFLIATGHGEYLLIGENGNTATWMLEDA